MTRVALLTPLGQGAIATVQLVGPDAIRIAQDVFRPAGAGAQGAYDPRRLVLGRVCDEGQTIDQAILALRILNDGSQVVELHVHGGVRVVQRVIQALQRRGAVLADGRAQSADVWGIGQSRLWRDALELLPLAKTRRVVEWLANQPKALGHRLGELRAGAAAQGADLAAVADELRAIAGRYRQARLLIEGVKVVLTGLPNAGKSTLANCLVGRQASIVSTQPGTTRDWVCHAGALQGVPITIVDSAGLASSGCPVEADSEQRALEQAAGADLRLVVVDASVPLQGEAVALVRRIAVLGAALVALNKTDLAPATSSAQLATATRQRVVPVSAIRGTGMAELGRASLDVVGLTGVVGGAVCPVTVAQAKLVSRVAEELAVGRADAADELAQLINSTDR
ncbi:MAG TPA: GTPase [Phycisphaerae bacterium]|nr:GTPase [Phycisphaerae bacterium]